LLNFSLEVALYLVVPLYDLAEVGDLLITELSDFSSAVHACLVADASRGFDSNAINVGEGILHLLVAW
jgi:hypothetical protein